jgi:hypothetical protein
MSAIPIRASGAALLLACAGLAAAAPPLPEPTQREFPGLKEFGEGRLRFLGLHVYDISLWTLGVPYSAKDIFSLELRYAIAIKGRALTERSIKEMRGLGHSDESKLKRWEAAMDKVFPDLKAGDRLVGVHVPGKEARFYNNTTLLGAVADPEFAQAFFGIWLDEKTSEPGLRAQLLKLAR